MEQLVQLLKTSHLIHSWQINNTFSSFLVLVENIKAFTGVQLCFSTVLRKHCSVVQTLQLQFEGMHGERLDVFIVWFQLFEAFIVKWISLCIVQ